MIQQEWFGIRNSIIVLILVLDFSRTSTCKVNTDTITKTGIQPESFIEYGKMDTYRFS